MLGFGIKACSMRIASFVELPAGLSGCSLLARFFHSVLSKSRKLRKEHADAVLISGGGSSKTITLEVENAKVTTRPLKPKP